jgi:Xaa-Pro aminopeptidase
MLNLARRQQLLEAIDTANWDLLLLYGHSWRKDFFRSLVNFNFFGPHALAALYPDGELTVLVAHPWDQHPISNGTGAQTLCAPDFSRQLADLLSHRAPAKIAVAGLELMEARFVDVLREHTNGEPVSATAMVEKFRRFKTPEEVESVRDAARLADLGYEHFVNTIRVGMSEYELVAEVEGFLKHRGAEDNFMLIGSGTTEVYGMHPPTERRFREGDNVTTELSPQVNGYYAQICRTLVLGTPSVNQEESFAIFKEAQQAAENFLKPGVNISDLARVQNDVFRREGFGEYTGSKYTRVRGHNLGLYADENPYVLEDVDCLVEKDMVLIAHPNTYLPMSGYMVFGDTLLVTADGCVSLNRTEKKLFSKEA